MQKTSLPIDGYLPKIIDSMTAAENLVLTAPPGSGKTTRVPAALIEKFKKIIVLVPKRIAAISAAIRIAEENNWTLGEQVGYQVRFENRSDSKTLIVFMTEGVFIKKLQDRSLWSDLQLIIFDEFHERSSQLDLALGYALEKQILEQQLKILVMSATLDTASLRKFLGNSDFIEVVAKPYPLEIIKSKKSQKLKIDFQFSDLLIETLQAAIVRSKQDILIFLPGLSEIRFIERNLMEKFKSFRLEILHGSIKLEDQKRILQGSGSLHRRIILSTNIAESSLTISGVDCVIDSGLVKKSVTESKIGFKRLELARISLFSAKQRAGRAARTAPGVCYQLWHELDERSMSEAIAPEILSSDLLEESLTLISLGINNPDQFSWLDRPKKLFRHALKQLKHWDLIDTEKGRLVQLAPLDIERSLLFVNLAQSGFQKEASRLLAFLETTNFDRLTDYPELDNLQLTELGRKVELQLSKIAIKVVSRTTSNFREQLISVFFKDFPQRIAKRKDKTTAISSLGRGVELSQILAGQSADYFMLLSGREHTDALTKSDFAIGLSAADFEKFSSSNTQLVIEVKFDSEKMKLYKIEKKVVGFFVISEAAKSFIDEAKNPELFADYFENNFPALLHFNEHYKNYVTKLEFLKKKTKHDFLYFETFDADVLASLSGSVKSLSEFFEMNLFEILLYATPENIKYDLAQLPGHFLLPSGKSVSIDYESELAPKISARIQDLFGLNANPTLMNGTVKMTIELLAPNYRPTQITSQLENFWKISYFEIRKELRARYPKHAWPDDPAAYIHIPRKK